MGSRKTYLRGVGAILALGCFAACTARVGSGGPGSQGAGDNGAGAGTDAGTSENQPDWGDEGIPPNGGAACSHLAPEVKIPAIPSTSSFAFKWDTDHYMVVYSDPSVGGGDIMAVRMGDDGTILAGPNPVEGTSANSDLPTLTSTGDGYVVAWQEGSAGKAVMVKKLDANAQPVGAAVTVGTTNSLQARPVVARAPGGLVVAWMDDILGQTSVHVAKLDNDLNVKAKKRIAEDSPAASYPWIAGDNETSAIIWSDKKSGRFDIQFARLDDELNLADQKSLRGDAPNDALLGRMARTDFGFITAWEDARTNDNQIFMSLTDPYGKPLGDGLVEEPDSGDANWPNIAWNGSAAGIVYYQFRSGKPQIFMTFVDPSGKRIGDKPDLQVSHTSGRARYPDVQWDGSKFGVIWVDTRSGSPELYFAHLNCE